MARVLSRKSDRRKRRWTAVRGGNRLDRLHQLLVGDRNHVDALPEDHPRRRPILARLRFLEQEAES